MPKWDSNPRSQCWSGRGRRVSMTLTAWHFLSANLALTSLTSGGRSVGIVRSRIQAKKFNFLEMFLTPRPTPKLEDQPLSFVRGCLSSKFAARRPQTAARGRAMLR
jgi:hypothetical protein